MVILACLIMTVLVTLVMWGIFKVTALLFKGFFRYGCAIFLGVFFGLLVLGLLISIFERK